MGILHGHVSNLEQLGGLIFSRILQVPLGAPGVSLGPQTVTRLMVRCYLFLGNIGFRLMAASSGKYGAAGMGRRIVLSSGGG